MPVWVILIIAFLLLTFFLMIVVVAKQRGRKAFSGKELKYIESHWIMIIDAFNSHPKHAILDADKLLDYALGIKGFTGSLGEKLKKAGPRFSDLNAVWSAHKLRNKVAHDLGNIDKNLCKTALLSFKGALNDLGAKL